MIEIGQKVIVIKNKCCHTGTVVVSGYKTMVITGLATVSPGTVQIGDEVSVWRGQTLERFVIIDELKNEWWLLYSCPSEACINTDWLGYRGDAERDGWYEWGLDSDRLCTLCGGNPIHIKKGYIREEAGGEDIYIDVPGGTTIGSYSSLGGYYFGSFNSYEPNYHARLWVYSRGYTGDYVLDTEVVFPYTQGVFPHSPAPLYTGGHIWVAANYFRDWKRAVSTILATTESGVTTSIYSSLFRIIYFVANSGSDFVLANALYVYSNTFFRYVIVKLKLDGSVSDWAPMTDLDTNPYLWIVGVGDDSYIYAQDIYMGWNSIQITKKTGEDSIVAWSNTYYWNHTGIVSQPVFCKDSNTLVYYMSNYFIKLDVATGNELQRVASPIALRGAPTGTWTESGKEQLIFFAASGKRIIGLQWYGFDWMYVWTLPFTVDEVLPYARDPDSEDYWMEFLVRTYTSPWYLVRAPFGAAQKIYL